MTDVTVTNRQRRVRIDVAALTKFANAALSRVRAVRGASGAPFHEINVVVVSDRRIAELHQQVMNISGPTDVITFAHGEIVISVETAARNASAYSSTLDAETRLYIVHGLLHLHGFDDQTARDAKKMARIQERIVAELARGDV